MYLATIDCGTTNSRVYIIDDRARIVGKATRQIGVKETAISGNSEALKNKLKDAFYESLENANLQLKDIGFAISSGMITSELGLLEIPHLWAPVSFETLAHSMKKVHDTSVFPLDIPVYFIRGIKNRFESQTITIQDVGRLDFMRGEETQAAGLLSTNDIKPPACIVMLSSHTKFISIDRNQNITGSITTVSGQVFEAITKQTFIGKSIRKDSDFDDAYYFDPKIINAAHYWVINSGFLRSMLMPRFLDVLMDTKWYERRLFVEAAIASEDMRTIDQFQTLHFPSNANFVLVGSKRRCAIYEHLLKEKMKIENDLFIISEPQDIDRMSINGSIHLARIAGLL